MRKATLQTLRTLTRPLVTSHRKNGTDTNGNREEIKEKNDIAKGNNVVTNGDDVGKGGDVAKGTDVNKGDDVHKGNDVNKENDVSKVVDVDMKDSEATKSPNDIPVKANLTNGDDVMKVNDVTNGELDQYLNWTPELLQEAMRHIYQRVLFEHVHEIQEIAVQVCKMKIFCVFIKPHL